MRHTQSRFPFPLVRPYFTAESLRGWWDGVVGREGQQQHRATTPTATPPLSRTLCGLRSHLEPNRVGGRPCKQATTDDGRRDEQQTRKATDNSSGRATGSAATVQGADRQMDRPSERQQRQNKSGRRKTKTPAQQTTVQDDWTAAVRDGPRPTPPSACLTHAVRNGIGRSPDGTPAISSLGPPEVRVGFRTAPQTILRGEEEAQVAIRREEANGTTPLGELRL